MKTHLRVASLDLAPIWHRNICTPPLIELISSQVRAGYKYVFLHLAYNIILYVGVTSVIFTGHHNIEKYKIYKES